MKTEKIILLLLMLLAIVLLVSAASEFVDVKITGTLNMTSNNITDTNCITFVDSTGADAGTMCGTS